MKKLFTLICIILSASSFLWAQEDREGSKDPELFTRMPNYYIVDYTDEDYGKSDYWMGGEKYQPVEGRHLLLVYSIKEGINQTHSGLQITRNYINALKKIGGQVVTEFEDGGTNYALIKLVKNGKETWAQIVSSGGGTYSLDIIEKKVMDQDVVADASSMANSIKQSGKVAVYGIFFDTGKSTLKAESQAALTEIGKLLKTDPSLKVYVVGHTDNTGAFDANMKLSMERAVSVTDALVKQYGANAANLKPCGDGPTAPVASNDTEEGKALNRRVELVKQ